MAFDWRCNPDGQGQRRLEQVVVLVWEGRRCVCLGYDTK